MNEHTNISQYLKGENNSIFYDEGLVMKLGGKINVNNVLDYFSFSHFYNKHSINNLCSVQKINFEKGRFNFKGIEYTVESKEVNPMVICMSIRISPSGISKIAYYSCYENGELKQCHNLYELISCSVKSITKDYDKILEILDE